MGQKSNQRLGYPALLSVSVLLLVVGCLGTVKHEATFSPEFSPKQASLVQVGDIVDAAPTDKRGNHADFDIATELRMQLNEKLKEHGLLAQVRANPQHYVLAAEITDYQPGSAFKRWLLPGMGSTVLSVECKLYDGANEVGTVQATRSVDMGGGYSAGAWKSIFAKVADDIVADLQEKLAVNQ